MCYRQCKAWLLPSALSHLTSKPTRVVDANVCVPDGEGALHQHIVGDSATHHLVARHIPAHNTVQVCVLHCAMRFAATLMYVRDAILGTLT